ncbi:MAG: LacI family transcriptional regulator [Clostridiales bacterium]|jgi:DNA-binding LacI/PurR family transcriptional regulator|nr:LacI family transcriptional regulator [Clostridiales bacterium]
MPKATLKDVAKRSGLSVTTTSRVLGGGNYPISQSARGRVLESAKELGYAPNLLARGLKNCVSNEIAVVMPTIENPFYTAMAVGIESALDGSGYSMLLYFNGRRGVRGGELAASLKSKMVAGAIVAADCVCDGLDAVLLDMRGSGAPVVVADYELDPPADFCGVYFDYFRGSMMSTRYLLDQGHEDIAFATTMIDRVSRKRRVAGFKAALGQVGRAVSDGDIFQLGGGSDYATGLALAEAIAGGKKKFTAVSAINDAVAAGLVNGFARLSARVPQDISVMGFDDSIFAEMTVPPLTTVAVPAEAIGEMAARRLLDSFAGSAAGHSIYIPMELRIRDSVRRV